MAEPVKVLEMIGALNYGGSQAMIVNLCRAMNDDKVQCDFIVDHPEYMGMAPAVEEMGSKIFIMPTFKGTNISQIKEVWEKFFNDHPEYRILHSHSRSYASIYLPIAKKHGVKTIIHSHNTSNGKGPVAMVKDIMQYPLRNIADYFIGCSKEAGEWLFGEKVVKGDRFYVLNNAIDTDKFIYDENIRNEYRNEFHLDDQRVFIQVGRLSKQKNYMFTLDVFKKYLENDHTARLFIVGNGELKENIQNRIMELKIFDNVIMLEGRNDVNNLLQMADVFLMPSLFEGLSVACVEAQASGIRCLLSTRCDKNVNITGLCEFIPLDEDLWVKKMGEDLSLRMYTKDDIIKAGFDVKTTARWLEDFYQSIVK
ncbi:MAG: glycosyltransferase [Erysipelotrichaceae bacterium]|nr:glycosyltransferase [Erysipelotrichaceae bacterium]